MGSPVFAANKSGVFGVNGDQPNGHFYVFVDGEGQDCAGDVADCARLLCAATEVVLDPVWSNAALELVRGLCNSGALALEG